MPHTAQATPSTAMGQRITCSIDLSLSRRRVGGPSTLLDQLGPPVGRGEFTIEPVPFLTLQSVDPVQRGRTRFWMFRFLVHQRTKLMRGYSEVWDLRKNYWLHSMNGFSKVSRVRRHQMGWPNSPRLAHGSPIRISHTAARSRRKRRVITTSTSGVDAAVTAPGRGDVSAAMLRGMNARMNVQYET